MKRRCGRARRRCWIDCRSKIDPDALAESLSAAHRQLLQVARALAFDCRILVLDEPTTALTDAEADHLFDVLRELKKGGTTILYVSHRLPEVFRLCDRITVLRDGAFVGTFTTADVSTNDIVKAMVGQRPAARRTCQARRARRRVSANGQTTLVDPSTCREPDFHDSQPECRRGEIVGLFGLVGSGRSELLETIFGLHPPTPARSASTARRVRFDRRATRRAPASCWCPKSASGRGCSSTSISATTW